MASIGSGAIAGAATDSRPRQRLLRGPRFIAEVFIGADDALAALEAVQGGLVSSGFQSLNWLTVLYEELAPAQRATPCVVVVTERNSGDVAIILPLLIKRKRRLRVAKFADLGMAGCGGPILGPAALVKPRSIRRAWRAIRHALRDIELIRLERMPAIIGRRVNPLMTRAGLTPARHTSNVLTLDGTFEEYMAERGREYARNVDRCRRLLAKEGTVKFYRAVGVDEVARVFSLLEEQQAARHGIRNDAYSLDDPEKRAFYERLAVDGTDADFGYLFALEVDGEIIASLFGILHEGTFAMLRISTAGEAWKPVSAGRLIVLDAIRYFSERGVKRFDLGLRDEGFKRSFGAIEMPLYDLIVARDLSALPRAAFHRAKGRLRGNTHLRAFSRRLGAAFGR